MPECRRWIQMLFVAFVMWPHVAAAQTPELPRVILDFPYPTQTGTTRYVAAGQSIQAAIDVAVPGDTIMIEANATFVEVLTLKHKPNPQGKWIVIRSSSAAFDAGGLLAAGTRVDGANAVHRSHLVHLKSWGNNAPVIDTEWNYTTPKGPVTHYRLVGLEMMPGDAETELTTVVELGRIDSTSVSASDIVVDRCYVHGHDPLTSAYRRGIALNGGRMAVIDSYVSNFHTPGQPEAQAIAGMNSVGPFKVVNNYLEAAGEVVIFGGTDPRIDQAVSADIEVRKNYMTKRPSWFTTALSVKNIFELKNARRVLVEGNIMENSWPGQQWFAIVLTPKNQEGGCTWCTIEDITIRHNIIRHAAGGVQVLGTDYAHPSGRAARIRIFNNLFEDINGPAYNFDNSRFLEITNGPVDLAFEHNTILNTTTSAIYLTGPTNATRFVFRDNLIRRGEYGVMGADSSEGVAFGQYAPDGTFVENAVAGVPASVQPQYPTYTQNLFPSYQAYDDAFENISQGDYRLKAGAYPSNPDIGADIQAINNAINGSTPPPEETLILQDNFDDNSLASAWIPNDVFSGATDLAVPVSETNQRIEIGPIPNQPDGTTYNGIRTNGDPFTNGYAYVQLVQPASSLAYSMFTVGGSSYYRIYVHQGTIVCEKKINGVKATLGSAAYSSSAHQFLRISHNSATGRASCETAPNNLGTPGNWAELGGEAWNTTWVPLSSVMFELKAGVSGPDAAAGTALYDNFKAARR